MNHIDNNPDINLVIARYLSGNATSEEIERLREWIEQSPENKKDFYEQQDIWETLLPAFDVTDSDTEKAERNVLIKTGIEPRRSGLVRKLLRMWARIAAVTLLPILAIAIYFLVRLQDSAATDITLSTDYGCTSKASLPDGSVVWLNANSTLEYSGKLSGNSRDVNLRGEAYFNVHADSRHPFIVHTPYMSVTATGTEFNVNAYDDDASVTLAKGKVTVTDASDRISLLPGEHLALRNGHPAVSKSSDLGRYCGWRDGVLIFEDDSIHTICRRLEQIYNVNFVIDPSLNDRTFRFILKGENLSEIMHLFELTAPVSCISESNNHTPDSPQIIHIKPNN